MWVQSRCTPAIGTATCLRVSKDRERIAGQGKQCRSREGKAMNGLISRLIYPGARRSVDVGQVERTLQPGEELVWQKTTRDERIGLIIRPPAGEKRWIVFFYGNGMTVAGTLAVRRWLGSAGYGVVCVEYAGFGVSSGSPSEYGCYRSADAAITYLQRQASATLDQITLIGWSLGSAVAIELASRRDVRAQVLLSPLTSLLA
ncbi:MAG: alpha/beta hydrolase [Pseudonocardiaceae bacterium]